MLQIEKWKVVLILLVSFLGIAFAAPNLLPEVHKAALEEKGLPWFVPHKTINLGLDLRGGSHLLLQADMKAVIAERFNSMEDAARTELRKQDIGYTDLRATPDGVMFKLTNADKDRDAAYKIASGLEQLARASVGNDGIVEVKLDDAGLNQIKSQVINQSIEIVRRRVDESGTKEPIIQRQGVDRIVVQLPGVDDPERIKALIGKTAKMTFHLLDHDAMNSGKPGVGSRALPVRGESMMNVVIKKRVMVSGDMLVDSQPSFEQGAPVVSFRFNAIGAKRFCEVTRDNVGKPFAIVLDDEVISYPRINSEICGGSGIITGGFTVKEANDLALLLRAGALPAPLAVVEERSVGPTLGADSIAAGKFAAVVAFVMVFCLMAATYGLFGLFANIALTLNIFMIIAVLSLLQATLTLPGIAGIILTIGIAVDANVLIYERIREEIQQGRSVLSAVDSGYRMAFNTIIDSNLTTLIVAIILFSFGSGPIKGFAVAMCIGTITSMFSAIMITRLMVLSWIKKKRPSTLAL